MAAVKLKIINEHQASSCFFRSMVAPPHRKALIKITDRCNLRCAHCFVSADATGDDMPLHLIRQRLIPQLVAASVSGVTITGGEPFAHPDLVEIVRSFRDANMSVSVCTNGTRLHDNELLQFKMMGDVKFNISLDGFSAESHGRFRGDKGSFEVTLNNARRLASNGLLKGLLATPNQLAAPEEYAALCQFAVDCGAQYVLMNPLSSFGRGVKSKKTLAADRTFMERVRTVTSTFTEDLDVVPIRFPNGDLPLSPCLAGSIIYVFTKGDVTVCPYLVFAAETRHSRYKPQQFIVGNVFESSDLVTRLNAYRFDAIYRPGDNPTCGQCSIADGCGKGCPAAVIAEGGRLGDVDEEVCPKMSGDADV